MAVTCDWCKEDNDAPIGKFEIGESVKFDCWACNGLVACYPGGEGDANVFEYQRSD